MRKYFLGIIIGVVFLVYSMLVRNQHSAPVIAPVTLSKTTTTTPPSSTTTTPATTSAYKDGTYTGSVDNAFYGNVQVSATITEGKITAVNFLQYPNDDPNSIYVNTTAIPFLKQEAIKAQSSKVSVVSGATYTSQAFSQSLASALNQAKQS
jgi:uncharacterized protein with FMN-binding domain